MAACLLIQQPNHMKLITITDRTSELVEELTVLWEASGVPRTSSSATTKS